MRNHSTCTCFFNPCPLHVSPYTARVPIPRCGSYNRVKMAIPGPGCGSYVSYIYISRFGVTSSKTFTICKMAFYGGNKITLGGKYGRITLGGKYSKCCIMIHDTLNERYSRKRKHRPIEYFLHPLLFSHLLCRS